MQRLLFFTAFLLLAGSARQPLRAQNSLDLTVRHYGIAIGDAPRVNGLRLNFRDRHLEEVNGVNITVWRPYEPVTGTVHGIALGLPVTGAASIYGVAAGILGAGTEGSIHGLMIGGLGAGSGGDLMGIGVGGLGIGSGGNVGGVMVGGLGVGAGGDVTGIAVGGMGVGSGGNLRGVMVGGLGVGSGGNVSGLMVGGLGVGSGQDFTGIGIGGIGVGAGGDATGLFIGGVGVGSGGTLNGLGIGGVGVGAPAIRGIVLAGLAAGSQDAKGLIVAPAYFKIETDGRMTGVAVSAFNHIRGTQHGLTIGIYNYARRLRGVQIGVLNVVRENPPPFRVLPLVNARL